MTFQSLAIVVISALLSLVPVIFRKQLKKKIEWYTRYFYLKQFTEMHSSLIFLGDRWLNQNPCIEIFRWIKRVIYLHSKVFFFIRSHNHKKTKTSFCPSCEGWNHGEDKRQYGDLSCGQCFMPKWPSSKNKTHSSNDNITGIIAARCWNMIVKTVLFTFF